MKPVTLLPLMMAWAGGTLGSRANDFVRGEETNSTGTSAETSDEASFTGNYEFTPPPPGEPHQSFQSSNFPWSTWYDESHLRTRLPSIFENESVTASTFDVLQNSTIFGLEGDLDDSIVKQLDWRDIGLITLYCSIIAGTLVRHFPLIRIRHPLFKTPNPISSKV